MRVKLALRLQLRRDRTELLHRSLQIVRNLLGQNIRLREVVGVFEAFVLEPEDIEIGLISFFQIVVVVGTPTTLRRARAWSALG